MPLLPVRPSRWPARLVGVLRGIAVAGAFAVAAGCASSGDDGANTGATSSDIVDGKSDKGDPAVMALLAMDDEGHAQVCTAEIIAPRVALTAGHCTLPSEGMSAITKYELVVAPNATAANTKTADIVDVDRAIVHPSYDPQSGDNDIALIILSKATAITPLTLNRDPAALTEGLTARIVGYGETADGDSTTLRIKHQGTVDVSQIDEHHFAVSRGTVTQCHGDSGGPALVKIGGQEKIVGVSWKTIDDNGSCSDGSTDTRVDAYVDFIDPIVADPDANAPTGDDDDATDPAATTDDPTATPSPTDSSPSTPPAPPTSTAGTCTDSTTCNGDTCSCGAGVNIGASCDQTTTDGDTSCRVLCLSCPAP